MSNSTKTLIDDQEGLSMKKVIENLNESEIDVFKRMTQIDLSNNDLNNETCKEPTNNDLVSKLKARLFIRLYFIQYISLYKSCL